MPATMNDLPDLIDKVVTVQVDISAEGTDEDFRELVGKLLAVSHVGIVLQTKNKTEIIKLSDLLDIEETTREPSLHIVRRWIKNITLGSATSPIVKRWVEEVDVPSARQHLSDRHGIPLDL